MSEVESLRNQCYTLFDTKNIFNTTADEIRTRCKALLGNKNVLAVLESRDLVESCELFFASSLNTTEASNAGFMHRNTLIYRMDKIKHLIGLDIRDFSDAVVLRNMITYYKTYYKG